MMKRRPQPRDKKDVISYVAEVEQLRECLKPLYDSIMAILQHKIPQPDDNNAGGLSVEQDPYDALYDSMVLLQHLSSDQTLMQMEIDAVRSLAAAHRKYQQSCIKCLSSLCSFVNEDVNKGRTLKDDMEVTTAHLTMYESRHKRSPTPKNQKDYDQAKAAVDHQWKAFDDFRAIVDERKKKIPLELANFFECCVANFMKFSDILEPISEYILPPADQ